MILNKQRLQLGAVGVLLVLLGSTARQRGVKYHVGTTAYVLGLFFMSWSVFLESKCNQSKDQSKAWLAFSGSALIVASLFLAHTRYGMVPFALGWLMLAVASGVQADWKNKSLLLALSGAALVVAGEGLNHRKDKHVENSLIAMGGLFVALANAK